MAVTLRRRREARVTYVHSVASGRLFASVAFCESLIDSQYIGRRVRWEGGAAYPVEGVGKGVFPEVGEHFVINFESSEVC